MRVVHGAGQRLDQPGRLLDRQRALLQPRGEGAALYEFHRKVRLAVVLAPRVNADNVGVLQPGEGDGLATEPRQRLRRLAVDGPDHLEGDDAIERLLPSAVDDAHAAVALLPQDL